MFISTEQSPGPSSESESSVHSVSELAEENSSKGNTSHCPLAPNVRPHRMHQLVQVRIVTKRNALKIQVEAFPVLLSEHLKKVIYQTNSSFRCLEKSEVSKGIEMLRPGYVPPTPYAIGNLLLQEV
jgi:hypothetical protein